MAVSCYDVVVGALRKVRVLASGRTPREPDRDDTMEALRGLYRMWINGGAFGRLRDVIPARDYTACENERVVRMDEGVLSITLPATVSTHCWCYDLSTQTLNFDPIEADDGGDILDDFGDPIESTGTDPTAVRSYGEVRPPRDCAVVVINDTILGTTVDFIYDGHQKKWFLLADLKLTDEAPLAFRDPDGLKACLAAQIADEFGATLGPQATSQAMWFQSALATRFSMPRVEVAGQYF